MYVILYIFCVILVVYALFIGYNLQLFKREIISVVELHKFSVDVTFEQQDSVSIENKYDCNAKKLRKCDINDPTTLFGCRELAVRCRHFEKDTEFKENGETFVIPKNVSSNEGYALALTNISKACNPYHGDLVLVTTNADSNEYMLICSCKNPGYIGNLTILNACEDVFICNGQIDDINKPLEEINCKCDKTEHSVRYNNGLPTCKTLLVKEANEMYSDWSNFVDWPSDRKISTSVFNKTIQQNLKTSVLLNPCTNSAHDTSYMIPEAKYSSASKTCMFSNFGYPVRNNLLDDPASGYSRVDSGLITGRYESLRLSGLIAGITQFGAITAPMMFHDDSMGDMMMPNDVAVAQYQQVNMDVGTYFPAWGPDCETRAVWRWNCYIRPAAFEWSKNVPRLRFKNLDATWSGHDLWNSTQTVFNDAFWLNNTGLHVNNRRLNDIAGTGFKTQGYGIKLSRKGHSGLLSFTNESDWYAHYNTIT